MKTTLRRWAELLSRDRQFRRAIRVSGRPVELFVSPDAQLKYIKPEVNAFDADLIAIAERCLKPNDCVWDIGANVGVFAFAAAAVVEPGAVICVEADTWLAQILRRSRTLPGNRPRDIRVLPCAVADRDGVAEFNIAARGRASNALAVAGGKSQMGGVRETVLVPTLRLDTLAAVMPRPDFIKIDVEGAELLVLAGAVDLAGTIRPTFYIEVGQESFFEVSGWFAGQGYLAFDPKGIEVSEPTSENFFFVPRENDAALARIRGLAGR